MKVLTQMMLREVALNARGQIRRKARNDDLFGRVLRVMNRCEDDRMVFVSDSLNATLERYRVSNESVRIEIVRVTCDQTGKIRKHLEAATLNLILGEVDGFPEPKDAYSYLGIRWAEAYSDNAILVAPDTPHGFTVREGGVLWYLSVQNPPIVDRYGRVDCKWLAPASLPPLPDDI